MKFVSENWIYLGALVCLIVQFALGMKHTLALLRMLRRELKETQRELKDERLY